MRDRTEANLAHAIKGAADTVKLTGGAVEIAGVRIEPCDSRGQTETTRALDAALMDRAERPDLEADGYGWPELVTPADESRVAGEAHAAVYGARQGDYGHPREDFTRTAVLWQGLLLHKLADGASIAPEDVARCMIAVKLSRDVHAPKRDNRVDMAGYAITLDRLETGK